MSAVPALANAPPASIAAPGVAESLLDLLGNTPIVRLARLARREGLNGELLLKLEFQNPGASHKARIAVNMIRRAEARGDLVPGSGQTILEPTGGNTGLGLAIAANLLGYRLVLVIPDNYSQVKRRKVRLFGAQVVLSDSSTGSNSHGELARAIQLANPEWVLLNQQANPANPAAHEAATGPEILEALGDTPLDFFVGGVGTGGHLSGVGRVLKRRWPEVRVVAVQPEGCDLAAGTFDFHRIQGLAVGLVPANFDPRVVDDYVSVTDVQAARGVQALIDCEGIGAGLSTGANIEACMFLARRHPGARILSLAYDRVDEYLDELDAIVPVSTDRKEI